MRCLTCISILVRNYPTYNKVVVVVPMLIITITRVVIVLNSVVIKNMNLEKVNKLGNRVKPIIISLKIRTH